MKLTRRELGAAAFAPAAAPQAVPAQAGQELEAARAALRRNAEALEKFKLPMDTEPAFQFKA